MSSAEWDETLAERYRNFRYEFAEKTLAGRCVIVAGGTGGLGGALVALLAREGAHVVAGFRANRERALRLQRAMAEQFSASIELVEGDILDAAVRRAFLAAADKVGGAFAGAAVFPGDPARVSWEALNSESLAASFQSNYAGPIVLAKELGEALEKAGGGNLVLLATMQAVAPFAGSLNYAAPKAALVHAARILAQQWNRVAVNVVAPGATVAGMAESSVRSGKYDRFVASGAIPRFGRPEDIARAVRFFLEPGVYTNGQVLMVDGGLTLRRDRG
jgi:NAD(P)-dependent dehydrogenase (short-subunit alcohol dehydrogenase family)